MRHFADPHMHKVQRAGCGCGKEPAEHGDDDPTCLLVAEIVRGEERNQYGDEDRRDPIEQMSPLRIPLIRESFPLRRGDSRRCQGLEILLNAWRARSANGDFGSRSMILWNWVRACTVSFSF